MFKDAFKKIEPQDAHRIFASVNPHFDQPLDPGSTKIVVCALPFYKGWTLAELAGDVLNPGLTRTAVFNDQGSVKILNWTNAPIYDLNDTAPLVLDGETVLDYIRFFFSYVKGSGGRFILIDTVDDLPWKEEPSASGRKALSKMIEPLHIKRKSENGDFIAGLTFIFRDSLFQAEAHMSKTGRIALHEEELLVEALPIADDLASY